MERLTQIAKSQPHAAYAAFVHGLIGRWVFMIRVSPSSVAELLVPLEKAVRQKFVPTLTGQLEPNDTMRALLSLPTQHGGLGIVNATDLPEIQQRASAELSKPIVNLIRQQGVTSRVLVGYSRQ